jgi:hypothetical protein
MTVDPRPALRCITKYSAGVLLLSQNLTAGQLDGKRELKRRVLWDLSEVAWVIAGLSPAAKALRPEAPWLEFASFEQVGECDLIYHNSESLLRIIGDHLENLRGAATDIARELDSQGLIAPRPLAAPLALYQLKLTLAEVQPPVWRRLLVPNDITLRRLHNIIQEVGGRRNYHLYQFVSAGTRYGRPDPCGEFSCRSDAHVRLNTLPLAEGTTFKYVYDFGDHWEIEIQVEKVLPLDSEEQRRVVCLDGARAFPREDSGGVRGYETLLEALTDPRHPEHEEYRNWASKNYDAERFDIEDTNGQLRRPINASAYRRSRLVGCGR